jgi:hypothetical protein
MIGYRPTIMLTRRAAALVTLVLCLAGCARSGGEPAAAPTPSAAATPSSASVASSAPSETGAETVTGTVEAGVEPNCRLIKDSAGSHLLVFHDAALKPAAAVGKKVTVTGRSEPKMMTTCQQGIPFVVSSVSPA